MRPPPKIGAGRRKREPSVGITVMVRIRAQPRAMPMVKASGANIFPAIPCNDAMGRKTTTITATPKLTGRTTSKAAWRKTSRRSRSPPPSCPSRRTAFSTRTMAPSPSMPIAMARPDSVIRLSDIPRRCITRNVDRAASGSCTATSSAERRWPMKKRSTRMTNTAPCRRAARTVPRAVTTSSLRS